MANEFQLNLEKNNNKIQEILSYFVGNGVVKVSNYCTEVRREVDIETETRMGGEQDSEYRIQQEELIKKVDAFEKDCTQRLGTLFNN